MSLYISPQDELHVEYQGIALTCPHCQTMTHLTAAATPRFEDLSRRKPKHVGLVFRCDACAEPVFLKFAAKAYTALRVELAANYVEIERARENFPLTYLPEEAEGLFKEALSCYSAGCFNAFGAMSRRTAQSLFRELGERGKLELFDTLQGNPRAWPNSTMTPSPPCGQCSSAATAIPGRTSPTSMPSVPECCSKSCATCCTRPSCARRASCRP